MAAQTGISRRHGRACKRPADGRCDCPYRAEVYSVKDGRKIRKTFPTLAAAKAWRDDASTQVRRGVMRAPTPQTIQQAWDAWADGARAGTVHTRAGGPYKPSAIRSYNDSMRLRIIDDFGRRRLSDVGRVELQDLIDRLVKSGLGASTVQCTLLPLRALYRRALVRGEIQINPTVGLQVPALPRGRDRIADRAEGVQLLDALTDSDQALWATAMYAGLRRGELQALRWRDVDLAAQPGLIRVERSWDMVEGFIEPKSRAGRRTVPIIRDLYTHLTRHRQRALGAAVVSIDRARALDDELVFGRTPSSPFAPTALSKRVAAAWKTANLTPITLHEARHTYASLSIAAGVNAKALSTYMGHGSVAITFDRYGHLMPGNEAEAVGLLDAYLAAGTPA